MGKRVVIALGGNALGFTPKEQRDAVDFVAETSAKLVRSGNQIIIGHGNGPQVGIINLAMDYAAEGEVKTPAMPLVECGAMSQGYIGYHLQQAIEEKFRQEGIDKDVVCVVTQVEVDAKDSAFAHPTKPVGMFYAKEKADELAAQKGFTFIEDSGRGYRRVVPSPAPTAIVELNAINKIIAQDMIPITVGGGGIPVVRKDGKLVGVDAVIDKDKSCAKLANDIEADVLLILTAVEKACIHFGKPEQKALDVMTSAKANQYIQEGHFAKGSMLPKVEACLDFVMAGENREAIITSLEKADEAIKGLTGTKIVK